MNERERKGKNRAEKIREWKLREKDRNEDRRSLNPKGFPEWISASVKMPVVT